MFLTVGDESLLQKVLKSPTVTGDRLVSVAPANELRRNSLSPSTRQHHSTFIGHDPAVFHVSIPLPFLIGHDRFPLNSTLVNNSPPFSLTGCHLARALGSRAPPAPSSPAPASRKSLSVSANIFSLRLSSCKSKLLPRIHLSFLASHLVLYIDFSAADKVPTWLNLASGGSILLLSS